jgi:hypothetical protein
MASMAACYTPPTIPWQYSINAGVFYNFLQHYSVKFEIYNLTNRRNLQNDYQRPRPPWAAWSRCCAGETATRDSQSVAADAHVERSSAFSAHITAPFTSPGSRFILESVRCAAFSAHIAAPFTSPGSRFIVESVRCAAKVCGACDRSLKLAATYRAAPVNRRGAGEVAKPQGGRAQLDD